MGITASIHQSSNGGISSNDREFNKNNSKLGIDIKDLSNIVSLLGSREELKDKTMNDVKELLSVIKPKGFIENFIRLYCTIISLIYTNKYSRYFYFSILISLYMNI